MSQLDMPAVSSPIPMVARMLAAIANANTTAALDATWDQFRDDFALLAQADKETVISVGSQRRAYLQSEVTPTVVAESSGPVVLADPIGDRLNESAAETQARRAARRVNPATQSADAMRAAVVASRQSVTALLDSGKALAVDPASGNYGIVVSFGRRKAEVDPVTMRDRQALVRWSDVIAALKSCGLNEDILGKHASMRRHLLEATQIANHSGLIARAVSPLAGELSRWVLGAIDTDVNSTSLGDKDSTIALWNDGSLFVTGDTDTTRAIERDFARRVDEDRISSTHLREKLERALINEFGARDCDFGLYVAPKNAAKVKTFVDAFRPIAGRNIYVITVGDAESVKDALAVGFEADIEKLESDLESKRGDLRKGAGAGMIERIETLAQSAAGLAVLLGESVAQAYQARLRALDSVVQSELDATASRFANLELT